MNYVKSLAKQLGAQGRPREWSCAWADLEALAGEQWSNAGKAETIRKPDTARPPGSAGRTPFDIRATGGE